MKIIKINKGNLAKELKGLRRGSSLSDPGLEGATRKIVEDVRKNGDRALFKYTKRFDGVALTGKTVRVSKKEFREARSAVPKKLMDDLVMAGKRIRDFHRLKLPSENTFRDTLGNELGWVIRPIERAGLYVPGGKAAYPSTVLMTAIPAKVAGVKDLALVTPCPWGQLNPAVLAAAETGRLPKAMSFAEGASLVLAERAYVCLTCTSGGLRLSAAAVGYVRTALARPPAEVAAMDRPPGVLDELEAVQMRVGALPQHPNNVLKYSLTWSTDGLINEYGNLCYGIEAGEKVPLQPLEGYETIELDGLLYEAFNTSGGLGTLADTYAGQVQTMNYKTLRYPGHCEKIHLLMKDLKLNEDRDTLKRVLEHAVPQTLQDVVLIYASVTGTKEGGFFEENYVKKIYPQCIKGRLWSAIQVTTASSLCTVLDLVLRDPSHYHGFVTQESISLKNFLANDFGACFR